MGEKSTWWERIRGNAEWEAIKAGWPWARSLVITFVYGLTQRIRSVHIDWMGLTILFILCLIAGHLLLRQTSNHAPRPAQPLVSSDDSGTAIRFSEAWEKLDYIALHDRGYECAMLFTSLQMEALKLAHDLSRIIKPDEESQSLPNKDEEFTRIYEEGRSRSLRISGTYAEDYAPRVKSFLNKIRKNNENDIYLPQFVENVDSESSVELVIARLWVYVMASAGVNLKGQL